MSYKLTVPPDGSRWEVTGTPRGPWTWTSEAFYQYDANGFAISVEFVGVASAPGASAVWVTT